MHIFHVLMFIKCFSGDFESTQSYLLLFFSLTPFHLCSAYHQPLTTPAPAAASYLDSVIPLL